MSSSPLHVALIRKAAAFLILLAVGSVRAAPPERDEGLQWPLGLSTRYLTSNFMEHRPGRFHAGLDLKTRSQTGFAARAVENGWILRVRATPGAYGRAIYLRGESGRTYVYAHLSRFNDPIRARVSEQREQSGTYRVRLDFAPNEMPVRVGEVLGLSGQSGTSGPHLHFEVRDAQNRPVDPQAVGFAVRDTLAPVIRLLRALPAAAGVTIAEGGATSVSIAAAGGLPPRLPPLAVVGPVGFSAVIVDAADIRGHRLEPWLIEVWLDGERVYRCRNENFAFDEVSQQRLEWLELDDRREHWLHCRDGVALAGREGDEWFRGDEGEGLSPGAHEIRILAVDRAQNRAETAFTLIVDADTTATAATRGEARDWRTDPVEIVLQGEDNGFCTSILTPLFDSVDESCGAEMLLCLSPDGGDPVLAPTILAAVSTSLEPEQAARAEAQGLQFSGVAVSYLAADWPIEAPPVVPVPGSADLFGSAGAVADPADVVQAVYRWHRDRWQPAGALLTPQTHGADGRLALSERGLHAVFRDSMPPRISLPEQPQQVRRGEPDAVAGVSLPAWEVIAVTVTDAGSGVTASTFRLTLDGRILVAEPDLLRDRVLIELPADLPPGRHDLQLSVSDGAGLTAQEGFTVFCIDDAPAKADVRRR